MADDWDDHDLDLDRLGSTHWSSNATNHSQALLFSGYPEELLDFAVASCIIFILLGVPGNFITIVALLRYTKVRNATAMFIINLSVSDLMFCCFNLPLATSLFYRRDWIHGDTLCKLFPLMRYGLLAVSIFTVLAITLNRYIMIGHPRLYPKLYKRRHLVLMIALTWLGCFGALMPTLFGQWGVFGLDTEIGSCSILPDHGRSPKEFLFVVAFVLPCLAIIICYARIFFIVRRAATVSRGQGPSAAGAGSDLTGVKDASSKMGDTMTRPAYRPHSEPSFNLTCCESQQGSGSTDVSDETHAVKNRSTEQIVKAVAGSAKSNTILRWKDSPSTPIRIEVDLGSNADPVAQDDPDTAPGPEKKERRVSVTFGLPEEDDEVADDSRQLQVISQYLRVPERPVSRSPSSASAKVQDAGLHELGSTAPSEASSAASSPNKTVLTSTLSHVSEAIQRRSIRRSKTRHPGRMTPKDRKLLQMILVIFVSFIVCYMPITIVKILSKELDLRVLNILGYILIYLTTCINPIIYVVMSSEYRQAYKNLLTCKRESDIGYRGPAPSRSYSQKA